MNLTKKNLLSISILFIPLNVFGQESFIGKWVDKTSPSNYKYEFEANQDFTYIYSYINKGSKKDSVQKGVWEVGSWTITNANGSEKSCKLTIYADTKQCCYEYKVIANNLILTNQYKSESYGSMCESRVLVKEK